MYFSRIFKVKDGKLLRLKEWMEQLSTVRRSEAINTFEYENVTREIFVYFKGHDGNNYVIGLNEANEPYRSAEPTVPINQEHNSIKKECLEPISEKGEVWLDLP